MLLNQVTAWDRASEHYAERVNPFIVLHAYDLVKSVFSSSKQSLDQCHILDIGCGAGAVSEAYQRVFPQGIQGHTFTCTDISPAMVENARQVMSQYQSKTTFEFRVEDAMRLDGVADDSVDIVFSAFSIFLVPDREAALTQVRRVLKPGGTFALAAWTEAPGNLSGFGIAYEKVFFEILKSLCPPEQKDKFVQMQTKGPWTEWRDIEKGERFFSDAGFTKIRTWKTLHSSAFNNADSVFEMAKATPIIDCSTLSKEAIDEAYEKHKANLLSMDSNALDGMLLLVNASNIFVGQK